MSVSINTSNGGHRNRQGRCFYWTVDESLVKVRTSQLNGCAFCIDMHTKDARVLGETEQRLYALNAWDESQLVALTVTAVATNAWNRLVTAFRVPAGTYQPSAVHA